MRINGCTYLLVPVLFGLLAAFSTTQAAAAKPTQPAAKPPATYPQIVRLSYVEGDVRVARGKEAEKQLEKTPGDTTGWEQAVADLPMATGYSLATGTGRAEIEFEDASVVYLADNSVLEFYQISTTDGVPTTELALLTGTATLNVQTLFPGEYFRLYTPNDSFTLLYPKKAYLRVNSFLDAIAVTPQKNMPWYAPLEDSVGKTVTVHEGRPVPTPEMDASAMSLWDTWVAGRVAQRDADLAAAMKDAGVTEPIPGLAEMNGQGKFFSCAPYGTCWEPTEGWGGGKADLAQVEAQSAQAPGTERAQAETQPAAPVERVAPSDDQASSAGAPNVSGAPKASGKLTKADAYRASHPGATMWTEDYTLPCVDFPMTDLMAMDPATGKEVVVDSNFDTSVPYPYLASDPYFAGFSRPGRRFYGGGSYLFSGYGGMFDSPWDWGVCHAGSWIRWQHRYVWVAGTKRHHKPPVRWVKSGRQVGFVPLHPKDVAGKPPINMKDGVFLPSRKGGAITLARDNFREGKPVELLAEAPKEFRTMEVEPLKIAEAPHAEAYSAFSTLGWKAELATKGKAKSGYESATNFAMKGGHGAPMTFNRKTQSFMVTQPVMQNGRPGTVAVPLGGRVGSVQAAGNGATAMRAPSYGNGQNYHPAQGNNGAQSRTATTMGSNSNNAGSARTYTPAPSNSAPARTYTPAPSNSAPAQSYSVPARTYTPPPAPSYSPPPAPVYSPPPAPSYSPPPAPSNSGGSIRK